MEKVEQVVENLTPPGEKKKPSHEFSHEDFFLLYSMKFTHGKTS